MSLDAIDSLTPREREILIKIAEGDSLPEIAQQLHRSLKTIESHRLSLGRKLKASNRVELAKIAIREGLISIAGDQDSEPKSGSSARPTAETELAWLQQINSAVEMAVGGEYLRQFCLAASQLPGIRVAAVCTPDPLQTEEIDPYLRCVMAGADKGIALDPVCYDAHHTPCQQIIEEGIALFEQGVLQAYPQDKLLQIFQANSYIGISLPDAECNAIGGVGFIGSEPIQDLSPYRRVLEFFAPRVAAELAQHKHIEQLRSEQIRTREELRQREVQLRSALGPANEHPSVLSRIAARVDHLVGQKFLRALTDALCEECKVQFASICTPTPIDGDPGFYTLTISENGNQIDPIWFKSATSACELFDQQSLIVCGKDAPTVFPHATMLVEGNYQAYIGVRLEIESEGTFCGGLWVVCKDTIQNTAPIEAVLMHYAPRVAAVVDQTAKIQRLHDLQNKLESQVATQVAQRNDGSPADEATAGQTALAHLEQRVSNFAGPGFFRAFTNALCDTLGVRFASVCLNEMVDGQPGFNAISLAEDGKQIDTLRYAICGTPCQQTVAQNYYCCPSGVTQQFPDDELLIQLKVEGYVGICLETRASGRIGILWVVDSKPIQAPQTFEQVFKRFAPRLSAELEQFIELENLRSQREQLEQAAANKG